MTEVIRIDIDPAVAEALFRHERERLSALILPLLEQAKGLVTTDYRGAVRAKIEEAMRLLGDGAGARPAGGER